MPVAVLVRSLVRSHRRNGLRVNIFAADVSSADRERIESIGPVRWHHPPDLGDLEAAMPSFLTVAASWRLAMATALPRRIGRAIYIDGDCIVRHPLDGLWRMDMSGMAVATVTDPFVPHFGAPLGPPWQDLGIDPRTPYFNSGVMVADLRRWRAIGLQELAVDKLLRFTLPYGDQCAINSVVVGQRAVLHPRYNLQAGHLESVTSLATTAETEDDLDAAVADPTIVHFNTSSLGRPWKPGCRHPYTAEWLSILDETPWAGWRPEAPTGATLPADQQPTG